MVYRISPVGYRRRMGEWLRFSGSKITPQGFINYIFAFSFALSFLISVVFLRAYLLLAWSAIFVALFALMHGFLVLAVDRRTKFVESILPDALQLMAANSRAGYIPSRALILSARKEFGPLSQAIKNVGKEMTMGKPMDESLRMIMKHIRSSILERTVKLIIEGTRSGGNFASLLEENAINIRRTHALKKEVRANILMYTIFIGFAGCLGAPVLYALSSYLMETIGSMGAISQIPKSFAGSVPLMNFGLKISPDFLFAFSLAAILVTTVFGSIIVGLIGSGREKAGIKYVPILVMVGLVVFFLTKAIIGSMFAAFVPA